MDSLERPFDQQEYEATLHLVRKQTQMECHKETRQGVIKSWHTHGFNKSYLQLHPGRSIFSSILTFQNFLFHI